MFIKAFVLKGKSKVPTKAEKDKLTILDTSSKAIDDKVKLFNLDEPLEKKVILKVYMIIYQ